MHQSFAKHRRKYAALVLLLAMLMYVFWPDLRPRWMSPVGTELTEGHMLKDLKRLEGDSWEANDAAPQDYGPLEDLTTIIRDPNVDRSQKYLYVGVEKKHFWQTEAYPFEVDAAISAWVYLKERQEPYPINGILGSYKIKYDVGEYTQFISEESFDKAHREVEPLQLEGRAKIDKLMEVWIKQNNYKNWWERSS